MNEINHKGDILDLPIAVNADGDVLFHSLEWCKSENIVIVFDEDAKGWMRGRDHNRYRVIPTGTKISTTFPKLTSGRNVT